MTEVRALAQYRFKRAKRAYGDGLSLLRKRSLEGAVNRFYYAAFYSARALLALMGFGFLKASRGDFAVSTALCQKWFDRQGIGTSAYAKFRAAPGQ